MIRDLDDLTPANLGAVLGPAGVGHGAPTGVNIEPMGTGVGLLGTLARIGLEWPEPDDGPASVVVKLPTTDPANRAIVDRFGYDRREAGVYRDLLPRPGVRAPICLAQGWDDESGRGWLLLEDLGDLWTGDQVAGATDDEVFATIDALADWHAAWWGDPTLAHHEWLPAAGDPVVAGYGELFDLTWSACQTMLADDLDPRHRAAAATARASFDEAIAAFGAGPRTLVHGDARLDNLRFSGDGAVLLDFQLAAHGRGAYDLAFFCAGSIATDDRRRLEPAILDRYLARLGSRGVDDYGADALQADYVLGHALNLPNPVTALVAVTPGDERGAQMLRHNALRALAAAADHFG